MRKLFLLLPFLLLPFASFAQGIQVPSLANPNNAAPVPGAACGSGLEQWDGAKWNCITIGSGLSLSVGVLSATGSGGGTTYTAGPCITISGTVISNTPQSLNLTASRALATTDMCHTLTVDAANATPITVTFAAASGFASSGSDVCFLNEGAPPLTLSGGPIVGQPTTLQQNQGNCVIIDGTGKWAVWRGTGL